MSLTDVVQQPQPVQAQVQENSVVVALTGGVVAGNESHKRTSPDPERKEHSKHHKYVKVVGGKPAANMNKTPASISNVSTHVVVTVNLQCRLNKESKHS